MAFGIEARQIIPESRPNLLVSSAGHRDGMGLMALQNGFRLIPIQAGADELPARICVVVREKPDAVSGALVPVGQQADANIFLGALTDGGGNVREWLEIWVQSLGALQLGSLATGADLNNPGLDHRWRERADAFKAADEENFWETSWQAAHPPPLFLDLDSGSLIIPTDAETGAIWRLCESDDALREAKLPAYSDTAHRYLYIPALGGASHFLPLTEDAPRNENTAPLADALRVSQNLVPFNPEGGLMFLRRFAPVALEDYIQVLGGEAWRGADGGKQPFVPTGVYATLQDKHAVAQGGGHLFLASRGRRGLLAETLFLKIQLLADLVETIHTVVKRQQLPFLDLTADSFRVRLTDTGSRLPYFWTAKPALGAAADSVALAIQTADTRYFKSLRPAASSIYRPADLTYPARGTGKIRLREVSEKSDGAVVIEGTLDTNEPLETAANDLLYLRIPLGANRAHAYAHLSTTEGLAQGEARFRTLGQAFSADVLEALKSSQGVPLPQGYFEVNPVARTPCDLYALGVIAVQTLFLDKDNTLPVALDECLSLARQVAVEHNDEEPLALRVNRIAASDDRWAQSLGPHRLVLDPFDTGEAAAAVPAELWWETVGAVLRMFPGIGPDSIARDLGDVSPFALETAFGETLEDLGRVIRKARSLLFIDWNDNREVGGIIEKMRARHG